MEAEATIRYVSTPTKTIRGDGADGIEAVFASFGRTGSEGEFGFRKHHPVCGRQAQKTRLPEPDRFRALQREPSRSFESIS